MITIWLLLGIIFGLSVLFGRNLYKNHKAKSEVVGDPCPVGSYWILNSAKETPPELVYKVRTKFVGHHQPQTYVVLEKRPIVSEHSISRGETVHTKNDLLKNFTRVSKIGW